jgi:hypothetical protein
MQRITTASKKIEQNYCQSYEQYMFLALFVKRELLFIPELRMKLTEILQLLVHTY